MLRLKTIKVVGSLSELKKMPVSKLLISTINAHSYNVARNDLDFEYALENSNILLPDGVSIVWAFNLLGREKIAKISGWDLFCFEMDRLNQKGGGFCFFLGSNNLILRAIEQKSKIDYPNIKIITYSPPYVEIFTEEDNKKMITKINQIKPDLLWIGMTAPKQEKWAYKHFSQLDVKGHIGCIGAVFDFYAGAVKRAPSWIINIGFEWLYRLIQEPTRLWKRYIIGNILFIKYFLRELITNR